MPNYFEIVEQIYRKEDAFDEVLNGNLYEAIDGLQQIASGDHSIWAEVVYEILFEYIRGFFLYHFRFSYGSPEVHKPERQQDLERHLLKLLHTDARALISKVCIGALHGRGWRTLYGIRASRFSFTLNPLKLCRRFLARIFNVFMRLIEKPFGAKMGLEVLGLFDRYTSDEFDELMTYLEQHSYDEWTILHIVRLMGRPHVIPAEKYDKLVGKILSFEFTRANTRAQILAELAKFNDKALEALVNGEHPTYLVDQLVISAHSNPLSMKHLVLSASSHSSFGGRIDEVLDQLGRVEKSCAEVFLQIASGEEVPLSLATLVATHISALTWEAREFLEAHLNSPNFHLRYLAACALLQTTRSASSVELAKVFDSILEIAIGPRYLEVTNEAYTRRDPLQKMSLFMLLDLAQRNPSLIKSLLLALRNTWKDEFATAIRGLFDAHQVPEDVTDELVECLLSGNVTEFRSIIYQLPSEAYESVGYLITRTLDRIENNDFISYALDYDGSAEANLIRACMGYTIRIWPCLAFLTSHVSELNSPHFAVIPALLALAKPERHGMRSIPVTRDSEDSFVNICMDLSLAISMLETLDEDYILKFLTDLVSSSDYRVREQVMRALRFFPRANQAIMSLIQMGLADPEREVCQATQESLYCLPYLDADGVDLITETVVSPNENLKTTMSEDLVERSQPVAPSAVPRVIELLRNSSVVAADEVREVWLVEYCLNVLKSVSQEGREFREIYKQKLSKNYPNDDLRRHLRPYLILALGRARPVTPGMLDMFLNLMKPGMARMIVSNIRDLEFPEIKMAAAIALAEIGSDLTNGLDWNVRDNIAKHLVGAAKQPLSIDSTFVGGKDIFTKDPNDAIYQSAKIMALVMKTHKARERAAVKGIASLE